MTNVYVYVYTFKLFFLFDVEHTEVQYGDIHIGYGPTGLRVSNIANYSMKLIRVLFAGETDLPREECIEFLRELRIILESRSYCIFNRNCRHVSRYILKKFKCVDGEGMN